MTVSVGIAHAKWAEGRTATLERLMKQLGPGDITICTSHEREHASVWAKRLWEVCLERSSGSHIAFLNDDVEVPHDFVAQCEELVRHVPDKVIALHSTVDVPSNWFESYWLTGPGYLFPKALLREVVQFAEEWAHLFKCVNEDNLTMQWAWGKQVPIWHALPALVLHDVDVPSTLGYDNHPNRVPRHHYNNSPRAWRAPGYWAVEKVPYVQCPWMPEANLARIQHCKGHITMCSLCKKNEAQGSVQETGAAVCPGCVWEFFKLFVKQGRLG